VSWLWTVVVASLFVSAFAPKAGAQSICTSSFERWVKLSATRVRTQEEGGAGGQHPGGGEACIMTEAARQELLTALRRVRTRCDEVSSPDQSDQTTLTMLTINEESVVSLPLCRTEETKARQSPPPPAPTKPAHTVSRQCLEISSKTPQRYLLTNRRCAGATDLAVVEARGAACKVVCQAHAIIKSITVDTSANAPPQVNYQCILNQDRCTRDRLEKMFPECDW